jgi:hypothetical protein
MSGSSKSNLTWDVASHTQHSIILCCVGTISHSMGWLYVWFNWRYSGGHANPCNCGVPKHLVSTVKQQYDLSCGHWTYNESRLCWIRQASLWSLWKPWCRNQTHPMPKLSTCSSWVHKLLSCRTKNTMRSLGSHWSCHQIDASSFMYIPHKWQEVAAQWLKMSEWLNPSTVCVGRPARFNWEARRSICFHK